MFAVTDLSQPPPTQAELDAARPSTSGEEELQLQLALAMSKEEHEEDQKRRKTDEIKYQMAIEESKKSEVWYAKWLNNTLVLSISLVILG